MNIQISIKNYRCFQDTSPATFSIGKGFIAFVGPNNAGKSSLLKLFYELRSVWSQLESSGTLLNICKQGNNRWNSGDLVDLYDPTEIFCDRNDRPITIDFTFPKPVGSSLPYVESIRLNCARPHSSSWSATINFQPQTDQISSAVSATANGLWINNVGQPLLDASEPASLFSALRRSIYVGPFRNAINTGASKYFDISVGTEFINTWNVWKTGAVKSQNDSIGQVTEDIKRIFGFRTLEINAAQGLNTLQISINGKSYKLRELGSGLAQFIVVFGNVAINRPPFILLDEPELNLHPSLQIDFLTSLASYASEGVLFATHSLGLARSVGDSIYSLRRSDDQITCRPFEQTPNYAEFAGEMSFAAFKELGFEKILLVEGVTDVKTVKQFLRLRDKEHKVIVIPLGGDQLARGGVEQELDELSRITAPKNIVALVDSERPSADSPPIEPRLRFEATCKKLKFHVLLTQLRSIENYLVDRAIKEEMGPKYQVLQPYQRLNDLPIHWKKAESWRIARRMTWDELKSTDVGQFLELL